MLSIFMCGVLMFSATIINVLLYRAGIKRLEAARKLYETNKKKIELNGQQRKRICNEICRFKHEGTSFEELEWYCEICPLNTMN